MKHTSIKLDTPCEFINITPINPLISKCQIKVCYVSDKPNRNHTVITKEVAIKMANSLPGSPIVGRFNAETADFEEHNRLIEIVGNKIKLKEDTVPYGFVDLNAKVWFQKFLDDGKDEREYLMTEGYLWTGAYPEAKRILEEGNNHSMELSEEPEYLIGSWTKDNNEETQFFIINEAIFEKLCILGEEYEPCFEGSTITKPIIEFSYDEDFKNTLYSMMNELKELMTGGEVIMTENAVLDNQIVEPVVDEPVIAEPEENVATPESQFSSSNEEEKVCPKCNKPIKECKCEDKPQKYNLDEIPEYIELQTKFVDLTNQFQELKATCEAANETINKLTEFKVSIEKQDKQKMIDSFYMLSDEDKKDVIENIDTYSVDEIEAKLSVICVRNKVNFNLEEEQEKPITTFNLEQDEGEFTPAWIKAVRSVQKEMN